MSLSKQKTIIMATIQSLGKKTRVNRLLNSKIRVQAVATKVKPNGTWKEGNLIIQLAETVENFPLGKREAIFTKIII